MALLLSSEDYEALIEVCTKGGEAPALGAVLEIRKHWALPKGLVLDEAHLDLGPMTITRWCKYQRMLNASLDARLEELAKRFSSL